MVLDCDNALGNRVHSCRWGRGVENLISERYWKSLVKIFTSVDDLSIHLHKMGRRKQSCLTHCFEIHRQNTVSRAPMLCLKIHSIIFPSALHTTNQNSGSCELLQGNQELEKSLLLYLIYLQRIHWLIFSPMQEKSNKPESFFAYSIKLQAFP